jgi:hypothetical protein
LLGGLALKGTKDGAAIAGWKATKADRAAFTK